LRRQGNAAESQQALEVFRKLEQEAAAFDTKRRDARRQESAAPPRGSPSPATAPTTGTPKP
jgi:hypothetical protein